ncbi:MAG: tRNA adenosine(34) deaminase TadA [Clostridiales bacterium]|jgi:tRNA(adenine34) deaminase|nr:tRNA adenosine(34) deaminase TadA [Clostridiales bacterium]
MLTIGQQENFMRRAVELARLAADADEIPVAALIVKDGQVIAEASNRREKDSDPTAHAEILALRAAGKKLGLWNLSGCDMIVTLEPCAMCAGAIVNARLDAVYFGAYDKRFGYCGTLGNLAADPRLNHRALVTGGILEAECAAILQNFFKSRR